MVLDAGITNDRETVNTLKYSLMVLDRGKPSSPERQRPFRRPHSGDPDSVGGPISYRDSGNGVLSFLFPRIDKELRGFMALVVALGIFLCLNLISREEMTPSLDFSDWWAKETRKGTPVVVTMTQSQLLCYLKLTMAFVLEQMKKAVKNGGKQRLNFQYDPSSYVLNFDDGCYDLRENSNASQQTQSKDCRATKNSKWVYVLWVKSY
ncbi:hypothetical protein HHK36_019680 [Tetracentron sinense]|uniref:Uncharacterized protein n=1 Tax=Tetracentron sinense TaxID=13715 RepID=A0A834YU83_TETSI|nr:hypothetical protein HHK36_019680 [Tetracentron sinense]